METVNKAESKSLVSAFKKYIEGVKNDTVRAESPFDVCKAVLESKNRMPDFMGSLDVEEIYYWIGNIYTGLIPETTKKELAAYFTPPHIARYTISRVQELGLALTSANIIDPASGGAAFLTPLSAALVEKLKAQGKTEVEIGLHLSTHLSGVEIDSDLAQLSGVILNHYLLRYLPTFGRDLSELIRTHDSLRLVGQIGKYDAVISNPPYGKILNPPSDILERFADSLTDKQVNKYALFIRLAIDWAKAGGFIALVIPTSFFAGPSFGNLRRSILEDAHVLAIDLIDEREGLFVDVLQDACVLFMQKKNGSSPKNPPACRYVQDDGSYRELGTIGIPSEPSTQPWVLPSEFSPHLSVSDFFSDSYAKLEDYGYGVRAGYFVWNRQKERCREGKRQRKMEFPLVWAHCVKPNEPCKLSTHRLHGQPNKMSLVTFEESSECLISRPCIVLQRTTNRRQTRRLIAGFIPESMIETYGSLISENHTIVIYPLPGVEQKVGYKGMCRLLNSKPVDDRYRQVSGTVSVSVKLLKALPLPLPSLVHDKIDCEPLQNSLDEFIEKSYAKTIVMGK